MDNAHRALPRCSSLMTMTLCMRPNQILMEFSQLSQPGQPLPKRVVRDMSDLPDSYRRTVIAGLVPGADMHVLVRLRSRLENQASSRVRA